MRRAPGAGPAAIRYVDATVSVAAPQGSEDALATARQERVFSPGDRLALIAQNDPAFIIGMLAAWEVTGIAPTLNPMCREHELGHLLGDRGARAVPRVDTGLQVVASVLDVGRHDVDIVVTFSGRDCQTRDERRTRGTPARATIDGTFPVDTSDPGGAQLTHASVVVNAQPHQDWKELEPGASILGIAPLVDITGLVGRGVLSLLLPAPLVPADRFSTEMILDALPRDLLPGEVGELLIAGPHVASGCWRQPEATSTSLPAGKVAVREPPLWVFRTSTAKGRSTLSCPCGPGRP